MYSGHIDIYFIFLCRIRIYNEIGCLNVYVPGLLQFARGIFGVCLDYLLLPFDIFSRFCVATRAKDSCHSTVIITLSTIK